MAGLEHLFELHLLQFADLLTVEEQMLFMLSLGLPLSIRTSQCLQTQSGWGFLQSSIQLFELDPYSMRLPSALRLLYRLF